MVMPQPPLGKFVRNSTMIHPVYEIPTLVRSPWCSSRYTRCDQYQHTYSAAFAESVRNPRGMVDSVIDGIKFEQDVKSKLAF